MSKIQPVQVQERAFRKYFLFIFIHIYFISHISVHEYLLETFEQIRNATLSQWGLQDNSFVLTNSIISRTTNIQPSIKSNSDLFKFIFYQTSTFEENEEDRRSILYELAMNDQSDDSLGSD